MVVGVLLWLWENILHSEFSITGTVNADDIVDSSRLNNYKYLPTIILT